MERIISFLLFAALFYFMMRFGCGSHAVHGRHREERREGREGAPAAGSKDPVCGMEVATYAGYSEKYQNREYRFCSRKCLDKFDSDPRQYAQA